MYGEDLEKKCNPILVASDGRETPCIAGTNIV